MTQRTTARRAGATVAAALLGATCLGGIAHASLVTSGYDTSNGTGTLGPAAPGDAITRAQIISRAQDWMNAQVPYSQTEGWEDSGTGGPYRMDCSGFVSMAWGLTTSMVTSTLPEVATVTDSNISGDENINPGDALDYTADHVVLFDHWTDNSGDFAYDAEHTTGQVTNQSTDNIDDSTLEGYAMSDFEALQYNDLAAGSPNPGSTAADGSHQASPVVAQNDGTVDLLYQGTDGTADHDWYVAGSSWAGPSSVGGTLASEPSTVTTVAGTVDSFWKGTDGNLWHSYTTGGKWSTPVSLGYGTLGSAPYAVGQANGTIDVFWRGANDDHLWLAQYTAGVGWSSSAIDLGGDIAAGTVPAPVSSVAGTTDVFFKGTDGNLWHVYTSNYGTSWTAAVSLGYGTLGSSPTATGHADGTVDVTWRGANDDHVWLGHYTAGVGWSSSARDLGGDVMAGTVPTPVTSHDYTTDILFEGTDGNLWHVFSNDYGVEWAPAVSLGMGTITQPLAAGQTDGTVDVFWKGTADNHMWHAWYNAGGGWTTSPVNMGGSAE